MSSYAEILRKHAESPSNVGWLEDANAIGAEGTPGRPPFMAMYLRIENGLIVAAKYRTFGCAPAIAAGSLLTEMIAQRPVDDCKTITQKQLTEALGGLPADKAWCANFAVSALRKALSDYECKERASSR